MRVMAGFVIGSVVGIALGLLMGWWQLAEAILIHYSVLSLDSAHCLDTDFYCVWFRLLGESAKIFLIFLAAFC